ncbi:hypothetical protein [Rickettsia endosymbiont of Orchestes rusci]|uniref:hypothetical protein n=1 Tax=Rickettsia endosymbiont of Orchestes rusci TaxID=3066250 RepID=UPI00313E6F33
MGCLVKLSPRGGIVAWMVKTALDVIPAKAGIQAFFCHAELVSASIKRDPEINSE